VRQGQVSGMGLPAEMVPTTLNGMRTAVRAVELRDPAHMKYVRVLQC